MNPRLRAIADCPAFGGMPADARSECPPFFMAAQPLTVRIIQSRVAKSCAEKVQLSFKISSITSP